MNERKSRVESMAVALSRAAIVMFVLFLAAAIGGIQYVSDEIEGDPSVFRYLLVIATAGTFLIAAVIAWVGSSVIRALGRVRGSLLDAMLPEGDETEPPPPELTRFGR